MAVGFFGDDLLCAAFRELLGIGKGEGAKKGQMSGAEVSGKQRSLQTPSKGFGTFEILLQRWALFKSISDFAAGSAVGGGDRCLCSLSSTWPGASSLPLSARHTRAGHSSALVCKHQTAF